MKVPRSVPTRTTDSGSTASPPPQCTILGVTGHDGSANEIPVTGSGQQWRRPATTTGVGKGPLARVANFATRGLTCRVDFRDKTIGEPDRAFCAVKKNNAPTDVATNLRANLLEMFTTGSAQCAAAAGTAAAADTELKVGPRD